MREASRDFTEFFSDVLTQRMDFKRGLVEKCLFVNNKTGVRAVAHIDDPLVTGPDQAREKFWDELALHVVLKKGECFSTVQATGYLGREYEAVREDGWRGFRARHPDGQFNGLAKEAGLTPESKAVATPGLSMKEDDKSKLKEEVTKVDEKQHKGFRAIVGRMQWIKPERPDTTFSCKQLSHELAAPSELDWLRAKRAARYMMGTKDMWIYFVVPDTDAKKNKDGNLIVVLNGYCDADWAGCRKTRKSTSCCTVFAGSRFPLQFESTSQCTVALSTGEAEFYALGSLACDLIFLKGVLKEIGIIAAARAHSDSSTARSLSTRAGGSRKMRHIEARHLFVQGLVEQKLMEVSTVKGTVNPADLGTKQLDHEKLKQLRAQVMVGHSLMQCSTATGSQVELEINSVEADAENTDNSWFGLAVALLFSAVGVVGGAVGYLVGRYYKSTPTRPAVRHEIGTQFNVQEPTVTEMKEKTRVRGAREVTTSHRPRWSTAVASTWTREGASSSSSGSIPRSEPPATVIEDSIVTAFAKSTYVDALRTELREKGLSTKGLKDQLARRVLEARIALRKE